MRIPVALTAVVLLSSACGSGYLTPEQVREHIENPGGRVASDTIGRATDDFFNAQRADGAQSNAFLMKEFGAAGITGAAPLGNAASFANPIADIFCVGTLVAAIASFDECANDSDNCTAEFTFNSCLLRVGDGGDPLADGKIHFLIEVENSDDISRSLLQLEFDGWRETYLGAQDESMQGDAYEALDGIIAVEATEDRSGEALETEVIFSADFDYTVRLADTGFFRDEIVERSRTTAAIRIHAVDGADTESAELNIVAFVDEDDDSRDESVILTFAGETRDVGAVTLSQASLEVTGTNGNFTCTWSSADEELGAESSRYTSQGSCVDENGEEFTFDSELTVEN